MAQLMSGKCEWCGTEGANKQCAKCNKIFCCDRKCQVVDWKMKHKIRCGQDLPEEDPYTLICGDLDEFIADMTNYPDSRQSVAEWKTEFSRVNYKRCIEMFDLVLSDGANAEAVQRIKQIGRDINSEGGLKAMQACYYVLLQFITPENELLKRAIRDIQIYWDGVGRWEN